MILETLVSLYRPDGTLAGSIPLTRLTWLQNMHTHVSLTHPLLFAHHTLGSFTEDLAALFERYHSPLNTQRLIMIGAHPPPFSLSLLISTSKHIAFPPPSMSRCQWTYITAVMTQTLSLAHQVMHSPQDGVATPMSTVPVTTNP